jgi:uncharacterized protein YegP (UPF0339 family)
MADKRTFPSFLIYPDESGRWRWSYFDKQGKEAAAGRASYAHRDVCQQAIREMQQGGLPVYGVKEAEGDAAAVDYDDVLDLNSGQMLN